MFETNSNHSSNLTDSIGLETGQWKVNPHTGIISLTDEALKNIINQDPIEKWYNLDPDPIARGQFTTVYRCQNKFTGEEYAAKFSSRWRLGADCTGDLVHEVAVCALLRHTHRVVRPIHVFTTDNELILIMEYAPGGDLQTILDEDLVPYERNVIIFLRQLLEGLKFIHDHNIVHLDIKPQNLVLMGDFPDCCVKLCDFEISRLLTLGHDVREILGTADYVAPEIIHYEPITTKTDMWSFGVLTYVLLTGFLPFGGDNDQETFLEITRGELDFPEELFEDISEHAIDFIKRLLIRQPHLRMSAKECLDHSWMQADLKMQKLSSSSVYLNNNTSSPSLSSTLPSNLQSPLYSPQMYPSNLNSQPNLNEMTLEKAFDILESGPCLSPSRTPRATTPINITPTILTPMNESPRDTGLPPLYPNMPIPRICTSTHSSTSSLNRGNSRQSMERLRSMSKSREVLVERLQSSSQKKVISKSRERLFDGRYGLNRSREKLFDQRSFSHSVETLPPFDWMAPEDTIYDSYSSVTNMPFLLSMLPVINDGNMNNRLYKSMASIDRLNDLPEKYDKYSMNSLEVPQDIYTSRNSVNENSSYDRLMNRYQMVINNKKEAERKLIKEKAIEKKKRNNNKNTINLNDRKKHKSAPNRKYSNEKPNRNRPDYEKQISITRNSNSNSRPARKEPQKKKKEKQTKTPMSKKDTKIGSCEATKTNSFDRRRGSVSHIEQRIQERHERMQEMEKKKITPTTKTTPNRRRHSLNDHKSDQRRNSKTKDPKIKRQRSLPVVKTRRQSKPLSSIEGSPSSSLESVKEFNNNVKNKSTSESTKKCTKGTGKSKEANLQSKLLVRKDSGNNVCKESKLKKEIEIPLLLLDPADDGIFSRSNSMESNVSSSSGSTIMASQPSTPTADLLDAPLQGLKISDDSETWTSKLKNVSTDSSSLKEEDDIQQDDSDSLTIIAEEDESRTSSHLSSPAPSFVRSLSSNSSGIGSESCSDSSSTNSEALKAASKTKQHLETFNNRLRSLSINNSSTKKSSAKPLTRAHSIHLDTPLSGKARPWGEVCNGSVNRAFQMFNQKSGVTAVVGRKSSDPTSDRL